MSFGTRLTAARKQKGLTQEALGKGMGTDGTDASKAVVWGWEKGHHFPKVDQLTLICDRLGVSADHLLFGREALNVGPEAAEVAAALDSLPKAQRDWVLRTVRDAIELARETIGGFPKQPEQHREESHDQEQLDTRRRRNHG
jgi:transcriptional regulator with XRE-family HTH domain